MERRIFLTAITIFSFVLCLFLRFNFKALIKSPYYEYKEVIIEKNTKSSTVNLCVIDKRQISSLAAIGNGCSQYYLILSNKMILPVDGKEFNNYEIYENYDFELQQKSTVTKKIAIPDLNKEQTKEK